MPVAFDTYIKKPNITMEYTQEQILEIEKCSKNFFYFCKYVKVKHPDYGRMVYVPRGYQKNFLNLILDNRYFVGLLSRQVGKTVSVSVYILWYSIFNSEKTIGIVSNKEKSAIKILTEIKKMGEFLPYGLKPGANEYAKTSIEFENNTKIMASATSADPFRGESLSILFSDEISFVRKSIQEEFWSSNFPTLSASETSKVIVISTPNGQFNLFHRLYSGAEKGTNGFVCCKYDWRVIEGRDEKWKEEQIKILGKVKFNQEHEIVFIGSSNTVIDSDVLEVMMNGVSDPNKIDLNGRLKIGEEPKKEQQYFFGIDVAKGTGEHYSVIQVLKSTSFSPFKAEQVAVFQDNHTDVYSFSGIIYRLALYYNNAYLFVENNAEGSTIVSQIWGEYEYDNLVNEGSKSTQLGIRATSKTKPRAVLGMKKLIEDGYIKINDINTINELSTFIDKGNNKYSGDNMSDDLVSGIYWACFITDSSVDVLEDDIKIGVNDEDTEAGGVLTDVIESNEYYDNDFGWMDSIKMI